MTETPEDLDDPTVEESKFDGSDAGYVDNDSQDVAKGKPLAILEEEEPDLGPPSSDGSEEDED